MEEHRMKQSYIWAGILAITLLVIIVNVYVINKTYPVLHGDEVFTFGSSNSQTSCILDIPLNQWSGRDIWDEYMGLNGIDRSNGLNLSQVVNNQAADIHPPVYYIIFRALSYALGKTSTKMGYYLNVFIFLCCIPLFFLISREMIELENTLTRDIGALISTLVCSVNWGVIQQILFIRMYPLLILFSMLDLALHIKLKGQKDNKKMKKILLFAILAVTVLGSLTHYYYLVFAFFESLFYLVLTTRKETLRSNIIYSIIRGGAVLLAWRIYRPMSGHLFHSYYSEAAVDKAFELKDLPGLIRNIFWIFNKNYVEIVSVVIVILLGVLIVRIINSKMLFLSFTALCYLGVVAKVSPGQAERYFVLGYTTLLIVLSSLLICILAKVSKGKNIFLVIAFVLLVRTLLLFGKGDVNPDYKKEIWRYCEKIQPFMDEQCIYLSDGENEIHNWDALLSYNELHMFKKVYYSSFFNMNDINWEDDFDLSKKLVVLVDHSIDEEKALNQILFMTGKNDATLLYNHMAADAYIIS